MINNAKVKKLIADHIFFDFSSFFVIAIKDVSKILPPSTGPKGSKFAKPIPKLIKKSHSTNFANHKMKEGIIDPYFSCISCFMSVEPIDIPM